MSEKQSRIDRFFRNLGLFCYRRKWIALVLVLLLVVVFMAPLKKLRVDMSTEGFFHEDDPALVKFEEFRDQFGRDSLLYVLVKPDQLFSKNFLDKLNAFHKKIEAEAPYLDEVTSLVNVNYTYGNESGLFVEELMADPPETEADIAEFRRKALSKLSYKDNLISRDGKYTAVLIRSAAYVEFDESDESSPDIQETSDSQPTRDTLTDAQNAEFVKAVKKIVAEYEGDDFQVYLCGYPVFLQHLTQKMTEENGPATLIIFALIIICLGILFRRISGVIYPLLVVTFAVLATLGCMAAVGAPLNMVTNSLPLFLIAIGIGDSVHILSGFYKRFAETNDKEDAIAGALEHSGLPILLTTATTAAGFLSFFGAELAPISSFGLFTAVGVVVALILSLIMIPTFLAVFPVFKVKQTTSEDRSRLVNLLQSLSRIGINQPGVVIVISIALVIVSCIGISLLRFSHNVVGWLPEDDELRISMEVADREMKGSMTIEAIVDTGKENGLYDPNVVRKIEEAENWVKEADFGKLNVSKTSSYVEILKEIHQALNGGGDEVYTAPNDRQLIAQEMLLYENTGAENLEKMVDTGMTKARITLKLPWVDANAYADLNNAVTAKLQEIMDGVATVSVTGMVALMTHMIDSLMQTMAKSYLIATITIAILMIVLIGDLKLGLISMIPNVLPIFLSLGLMGLVGIPLNISTIMIGSIVLGLAVDDTMHFLHGFKRAFKAHNNFEQAIEITVNKVGKAIVFTTIILCAGYGSTAVTTTLKNSLHFAVITMFAMVMALLADVVLTSALLKVFVKEK